MTPRDKKDWTALILAAIVAALLVVDLFLLPKHANAEPQNAIRCFTHDDWVRGMHADPRWDKRTEALKHDGTLLEIWSDPSGEWILVWIWPNGQTCPMEAGTGLVAFGPAKGDAL